MPHMSHARGAGRTWPVTVESCSGGGAGYAAALSAPRAGNRTRRP